MSRENISVERINIAAFGKLTEKDIELDPKVNLITAPNEGGKSTLAAFMRFALYGFQGRSQSISDNPKKMYMPWSGAAASGSLTLNAGGRIKIERSVIGTRESASCTDLVTGDALPADKTFGETLLGLSCDIYEKTAFLSSAQPPKGKDEELADRLQNLVFSADEQISGGVAEKKLTKRKNALKGRGMSGTIYELEHKAQQLETRLGTELSASSELARLEAEVARTEKEIETHKAYLAEAEARLADTEKYNALLLTEEYEKLRAEAESLKKQAEQDAPSLDDIEKMRNMQNEYSKHKDRRIDAEASYADLKSRQKSTPEDTKQKVERAKKRLKTRHALCAVLWFVAVAAMAAGGAMFFLKLTAPVFVAALGCGAALTVAAVVVSATAGAVVKKEGFAHKAHLETVERRIAAEEDTNRDLELRAIEAARRVGELKATEDAALASLKAELHKHMQSDTDLDCDAAISELLKRHIEESALKEKAKNAQTAVEVFEAKHDTEALRLAAEGALKPEKSREQLELEKKAAQIRIDSYREKLTQKVAELSALRSKNYDPARTAEELSYTESELAKAKASYEALCIALEELEAAGNEMKASISPKLARRAAALFEQATDGAHHTLELDTAFAMTCDSAYGQKSAEHLSSGAKDGVYICLRLALIELLYGEKKIPLVLDDAFAHIDSARLYKLLKLLTDSGHQLIISSCGGREKAVLDNMGISYRHIVL